MFIYKITVDGEVYIGLDTKDVYKKSRWKYHTSKAVLDKPKQRVHEKMKKVGIENCDYEVLEQGFGSIRELALAEISYIKKYDSFKNGLNSSLGGDGLGRTNLYDS